MKHREKIMLLTVVILLISLFIKSSMIDPYDPSGMEEEGAFTYIEENYLKSGFFIKDRLIDLEKMSQEDIASIQDQGFTLAVTYKGKMRSYFLGVFPFYQKTIIPILEEAIDE